MRTVAITNRAKTMEKKLGLSKEYITFLNKLGRSGGGSGGSGLVDVDSMEGEVYEYLARSSTGYSFEDLGDDDIMHQDSYDDE